MNTQRRRMVRTLSGLLLCPVLLLGAADVQLQNLVRVPADPTVPGGQEVAVTVEAVPNPEASVDAVNLIFRTWADGAENSWTVREMIPLTGNLFSNNIPALASGDVDYAVECHFSGVDAVSPVATPTNTYTILAVPGTRRFADFEGWIKDGTGTATNFYVEVNDGTGDRWYGSGLYYHYASGYVPPGGSGFYGGLLNIEDAFIESPPLPEGVSVIYYTSRMRVLNQSGEVAIQVSTNVSPTKAEWETVDTLVYPRVSSGEPETIADALVLQRHDVRRVRFVRTVLSPTDSSTYRNMAVVVFDNILLSPFPADVEIEEELRNPGYPALDQDVRMRCRVTDLNPLAPTVNRRVKVWYQWVQKEVDLPTPGNFTSVDMELVGDDQYEGVIPMHDNGYMHYYYSCDFDGFYTERDPDGDGDEPLHSENRSANYWWDGETRSDAPDENTIYSRYEIRRYRSVYGQMVLDATPSAATVSMELVEDEVWQGVTLVTGITNLNWHFKGYGKYTNDAASFGEGVTVWGENDQGTLISPPIAGYAELDATNGILAELDYTGFLLMRFNTTNRNYIAKQAVYQNFDGWIANKEYFEESLGLYAINSYDQNFNAWAPDQYSATDDKGEDFQNDDPVDDIIGAPYGTANGWILNLGRFVAERTKRNTDTVNHALLLNNEAYAPGRFGNTEDSMPNGLEKLTYRARAGVIDKDVRGSAIYQLGASWALPQTVVASFRAEQMSPAMPYVSVLVGYQPVIQGSSCYEIRLVQISEPHNNQDDNQYQPQIWRWNAGMTEATLLANGTSLNGSLNSNQKFMIGVTNIGSGTEIRVKLNDTQRAVTTDTSDERLVDGGTVGFRTHDAVPSIGSVQVWSAGSQVLNQANFSSTANWYLSAGHADIAPWQAKSDGTSMRLERPLGSQKLDIWYAPRRTGASLPDEEDYVAKHLGVEIDSLNYVDLTEVFHLWDENFVELRYGGGEGHVVIDDPRVYAWRANTRGTDNSEPAETGGVTYNRWPDWDTQYNWLRDELGWAVLEGWVNTSLGSAGNEVQLERSRANPDLVQALVSPVLTNGIGSINFSYRVAGGTAVFAIERSQEGNMRNWTRLQTHTNAVGSSGNIFLQVRELFTGRIRVRLLEESDFDAILRLDNLLARDYPPRDETTWQGYNILVTDQQPDRLFVGQSAYLNNDPSEDTVGTQVLNEHRPFIQTPKLSAGIGEIAFWYRVWGEGETGTLTLAAAPNADASDTPTLDSPYGEWTVVTNLTVTNTDFEYFQDDTIFDQKNFVLRLYSPTNEGARICLDNVLVTDPVRPGFEIQSVSLIPEQPLSSEVPEIEVRLGRYIMNPENIEVFVSYRTGTNDWGYTNWWTVAHTPNVSERVQLEPIEPGSSIYRTTSSNSLPSYPVDTVVQYVAWGTHKDLKLDQGDLPIFQGTNTFENPAWYDPIDLNATLGEDGWSPYYYVYSCPPYSVWINEINYYRTSRDYEVGEYVELIGPATAKLDGWRVQLIDYASYAAYEECEIDSGFTLPNDTKGWGFFVWGDPIVTNVDRLFDNHANQNIALNGGIKLIRSMGAVEQKVCYGNEATVGGMTYNGYEYTGLKTTWFDAPLHLKNKVSIGAGTNYTDFVWEVGGDNDYTPGGVNERQILAELGLPPTSTYWITSVIGPNGTHDGLDLAVVQIEVQDGGSTQIVYTADDWYRIDIFEEDGILLLEANGENSYTWTAENVTGNLSNHVTFAAWSHPYGDVPAGWLSQWTEAQIAAGDADDLDLETEYLLNTDPLQDSTYDLSVTDVAVANGQVDVTVQLTRTTELGPINGTLVLYASDDLVNGAFVPVAGQQIGGVDFDNSGNHHTYSFADADTTKFYKAVIE